MSEHTIYLTIPKEKAERIITAKVDKCKTYKKTEDKIKIGDQSYPNPASNKWRVSLYDYKFKNKRIETPNGNAETGVLGTKMVYDSRTAGRRAKKQVSSYIETE